MSETKRKNLGRGLAALLGDEEDDEQDYASLDKVRASRTVPIEQLQANRFQPRRMFDEEALQALSESIKAQGLLQPILVRRREDDPNSYEIIAGERRWRAAQQAQLHEVPVVVRDMADREALEIAIVENVQRRDLTPLEESEGYQRLMDEFQHTQEDLARVVGKSRSHIANMLRLLHLPDSVKQLVQSGEISAGHARALLNAEDSAALAKDVAKKGLSVRETERLAQQVKQAAKGQAGKGQGGQKTQPKAAQKDPDTRQLEDDLSSLLGLRVNIEFEGQGGTLTVHYKTLDQLDDVLNRLNQHPGQKH
ncbi:chromosome partitioning protein ParB [Rhodovibrio sodomensis]|uniref:Chromosome partitioning protein ParB n=2 Tax=Rhodovibrio sodomensis TaxID=1088 RepID=A0ABS1DM01_9PROT|nr:chromosome partitioning protein ParB [Rhodovibrio sodomensis]